jgi:type VI secretion system protein ImpK
MSGDRNERTVIRLRPSDEPARFAPAPQPAAERTVFLPPEDTPPQGAPPEATVFVSGIPDSAQTAPAGAERTVFEAASAAAAEPAEERFRLAGPNPLLAAAAPILSLLARLHGGLEPTEPDLLGRLVVSMRRFAEAVEGSGASRQTARIALYALCETADELAATLPGVDRQRWAREGLVPTFFKTAGTGTGFFEALNAVLGEPAPDADLLELLHACLMLGYQGQYRTAPAGAPALRRVEADVLAVIRRLRAARAPALPLLPEAAASAEARRRVPVWIVGAGAAALLAAAFVGLRALVAAEGEALAASLLALSPDTPVALERSAVPVSAPPPPTPPPAPPRSDAQFVRVRAAVAAEPGKGITVEERGAFIVVTVSNGLLFPPGSARLDPGFSEAAKRIAAALDAEKGPVRVVGHTDDIKPRRTSAFKSNFDLSLARAQAVTAKLAEGMRDKARLAAEGKGEDEPVADNASAEGRAANRRVAIMLRKDDAP